MQMPIRTGCPADAWWIESFLSARWGATTIVVHGEVIDAACLPALIAIAEERRGLATYRRLGRDAELVTLDADPTGVGTGAALIEELAAQLRADGCERLWLTTTNASCRPCAFIYEVAFASFKYGLGPLTTRAGSSHPFQPSESTEFRYTTNSIYAAFSVLQ
jgi:GNAT superfamily N-acetyltransferase